MTNQQSQKYVGAYWIPKGNISDKHSNQSHAAYVKCKTMNVFFEYAGIDNWRRWIRKILPSFYWWVYWPTLCELLCSNNGFNTWLTRIWFSNASHIANKANLNQHLWNFYSGTLMLPSTTVLPCRPQKPSHTNTFTPPGSIGQFPCAKAMCH